MDSRASNIEVKVDRGLDPECAYLGVREIRRVHEGDFKGLQALGDDEQVLLSVGSRGGTLQPGDEGPTQGVLVVVNEE
eukprot:4904162-Heterocapsa_arctica.AAC.1